MNSTLTFPQDLLRFLYWVFFKPFTLNRYVESLDPNLDVHTGLSVFWRRRENIPELQHLIRLALFHVLVSPWLLFLFVASATDLTGIPNWIAVVAFFTGVLAIGVGGSFISSMMGGVLINTGIATGASLGFSIFIESRLTGGDSKSITTPSIALATILLGVLIGFSVGLVPRILFYKEELRISRIILSSLLGLLWGSFIGAASGVVSGIVVIVAFWIANFRIFNYIFEASLQWTLSRAAAIFPRRAILLLRISPIYWDEVIWFPLPELDQHLIAIGKQDREAAQRAIADITQSFRQQWAARNALIELTEYDVERAQNAPAIANIAEQFAWLPATMPKELEDVLPPIREIAQYAQAARKRYALQPANATAERHRTNATRPRRSRTEQQSPNRRAVWARA